MHDAFMKHHPSNWRARQFGPITIWRHVEGDWGVSVEVRRRMVRFDVQRDPRELSIAFLMPCTLFRDGEWDEVEAWRSYRRAWTPRRRRS